MIRPQILLSIGLLGGITLFAMWWNFTEIATGGITLIGALGMKILEKELGGIMQIKLWPNDPDCSCEQCTCDKASPGEQKECACILCDCEKCHCQECHEAEEEDTQS